jgi:penicillin-binding protein 1A
MATRTRRLPGRARKTSGKQRSIFWRWRRLLFLLGLLTVAGFAGLFFALAQIDLPPERVEAQTSFVCAADVEQGCNADNSMAKLVGEQDRVNVALAQVPQVMIDAVLSAEDKDFFSHGGVDPVGVVRALWADLRNEGSRQGGSTITQQYVKKAYLSDERTFTRKVKEAVLAIKLEQELTKEQILERYLNIVYFGRGAYGIGAAARTWFGHDLSQVTLPEAAYLAGLIRSPETADVASAPKEAEFRRHSVLQAMLDNRTITDAQYAEADKAPFGALPRTVRQGLGTVKGAEYGTEYFVEYVRLQLREAGFTDAEIYGGALRIYTTLDYDAQKTAWDSVTSTLDEPDDPAAALVAIDADGNVKAMIGGRNFAENQVNYALGAEGGGSGRQPGSAFKPFVLAAAVKQGISLQSLFNAPSQIIIPRANAGRDWKVNNAEPSDGVLNLVDATRESSNTVFAQLMVKVGPANVVPLAKQMGINKSELPEVNALVLGAGDVSPLEMASAYSTFAHRGTHIPPRVITRVERADGSVITFNPPQTQPLTEQQADLVNYALRQVVLGGTGVGANYGVEAAGKTGTTDDNRDAWFVGFLPNGYTTAVWVGYDNQPGEPTRYMRSVHGITVYGGTFPATIWRKYMSNAATGPAGAFSNPGGFPGKVLNPELTAVTSTSVAESTTTSSTATTVPGSSTTTSSTPESTTTVPDSTTTTTTAPPAPP